MKGILGITSMNVSHTTGKLTKIELEMLANKNYSGDDLVHADWQEMFPGNVIVKCGYCLQWGARKTARKHCGAAID